MTCCHTIPDTEGCANVDAVVSDEPTVVVTGARVVTVGGIEALRHWRHEHAQLVALVPGLRGYVQDHCTSSPEGGEVPYTGLGEVWFDSFESAAIATKTAEWSAVIADAASFMNLDTVVAAWADEHRILTPN